MSLARFAMLSLPACLLWAVVVGLLGYAFGEVAERALGDIRRFELVAALVLVLGVASYALRSRLGERSITKVAE